ncbi:MAG: hypothetical protein M3Q07_12285 [Pseudobdellovibrionaceae bacterium]|nr:hypothetical protein [Pseudobdellovibrionaceae bacterium]
MGHEAEDLDTTTDYLAIIVIFADEESAEPQQEAAVIPPDEMQADEAAPDSRATKVPAEQQPSEGLPPLLDSAYLTSNKFQRKLQQTFIKTKDVRFLTMYKELAETGFRFDHKKMIEIAGSSQILDKFLHLIAQ